MGDQLVFFFLLASLLLVLGEEGDEGKLQVNMKTFQDRQAKFLEKNSSYLVKKEKGESTG